MAWNFFDGPYALGLVPPEYRTLRVQNLCDGADFAKKLGVTDVATHMGFIPENPSDPNFPGLCIAIRHVAEHLKANGQYLLFESGQETPITMLRCFERVGTDNLAVNLDTANLILYGKGNPVDALDVIGKYVRNLHAKDGKFPTNGMNLGEETRLGEGKANFPALIRGLKALGYDSHITIEREIDGDEQIRDIIDGKKFLTDIITEVYGEGSVE
jgi:sugar phosphate isomerase/epimerase